MIFTSFLESLKRLDERDQRKITSFNLDVDLIKKIEEISKQNRIPKSMFVREALKVAIDKMLNNEKRGYVYLIYADRLDLYKIGKTKDIAQRIDLGIGAKIPCKVEKVHIIETFDMDTVEKKLHDYFQYKREGDTEFFNLDAEDVAWFKNGEYKKIPEINSSLTI